MADSACQQKGQSCAACCGLYNLALSQKDLYDLLEKRTKLFQKIPKDYPAPEMVAFRQEREAAEAGIPRHDPEVYVCPFLGFLDMESSSKANRPGCLAHPSRTGKENSQNFSFYGASICQSYDCRTKEEDSQLYWSKLCALLFPNFYDYGRLYADYAFFRAFALQEGLIDELWKQAQDCERRPDGSHRNFQDAREHPHKSSEAWKSGSVFGKLPALYCLFQARLLCAASQKITSFELEYLKSAPEKFTAKKSDHKDLTKDLLKDLLSDAIGRKLPDSGLAITPDRIADWIQRVLAIA